MRCHNFWIILCYRGRSEIWPKRQIFVLVYESAAKTSEDATRSSDAKKSPRTFGVVGRFSPRTNSNTSTHTQGRIQDLGLEGAKSSAKGARIEAAQSPRVYWGCGMGSVTIGPETSEIRRRKKIKRIGTSAVKYNGRRPASWRAAITIILG